MWSNFSGTRLGLYWSDKMVNFGMTEEELRLTEYALWQVRESGLGENEFQTLVNLRKRLTRYRLENMG